MLTTQRRFEILCKHNIGKLDIDMMMTIMTLMMMMMTTTMMLMTMSTVMTMFETKEKWAGWRMRGLL